MTLADPQSLVCNACFRMHKCINKTKPILKTNLLQWSATKTGHRSNRSTWSSSTLSGRKQNVPCVESQTAKHIQRTPPWTTSLQNQTMMPQHSTVSRICCWCSLCTIGKLSRSIFSTISNRGGLLSRLPVHQTGMVVLQYFRSVTGARTGWSTVRISLEIQTRVEWR